MTVPKPFVISPQDRSRGLNVVGEKVTVLASMDATSSYELFFQDGVAGTGPPPHRHDWDESFYVLQGDIRFGMEDAEMLATPGTLVHMPAGTTHWFRFEGDDGQMLSITGPGSRASAFFTQLDADIADGNDLAGLSEVAEKHGVIIP